MDLDMKFLDSSLCTVLFGYVQYVDVHHDYTFISTVLFLAIIISGTSAQRGLIVS
jgi:hypothetical protein